MATLRRIRKDLQRWYFTKHQYWGAESVKLIHSGEDYFATLGTLIQGASRTIYLQTYIFEDDETGEWVAQKLVEASKRGVKIDILVDGFGSYRSISSLKSWLGSTDIQFRVFSPLFSLANFSIGRRLHHKIIVFDSYFALVGGINIANKYRGWGKEAAWLDFAILVEGAICEQIQFICESISEKAIFPRWTKIWGTYPPQGNILVGLRQNDRFRNKRQITRSYIKAIKNAKSSIWIVASYFLPGRKLKKLLAHAAKRGVDVKIILSGISDIPLFVKATSYLYAYLQRYNIHIYEWQASVLHAKIATVDGIWVTIGSFNLNHLSAYASIEFNVDVYNAEFAAKVEHYLANGVLPKCRKVESSIPSGFWQKIQLKLAYIFIRFVLKFLAFFPSRAPKKRRAEYQKCSGG